MKLAYEGFTIDGQSVGGTVDAPDTAAARSQLREQGILATRLSAAGSVARSRSRRASPDRIAAFLRQSSVLIGTGTPLVEAITAAERQADREDWRAVIAELRRRIEEGSSLSEAMAAQPGVFDPICRTMAAAGESAGALDRMLGDLAELYRRNSRARRAIIGALTYPAVIVAGSSAVLVVLLVVVLPRFGAMFEALNAPVPTSTAILMKLGDGVREHWPWCVGAAVAAIVGGIVAIRTDAARRALSRSLLHLPLAGPLARSILTARMVRCLGLLLESKVTLLDALRLTRDAVGHSAYAAVLTEAEEAVSRGEPLSSVLERSPLFPASVSQGIASGERSGRIGPVMIQLGRYLDEDNETAVRGLARTVEPLLLAVLGVVIGAVAISLFLPLFDIAAASGRGGG